MEWDYEREYQLTRLAAAGQIVMALILLIVAELIRAGVIPVAAGALAGERELTLVRAIFTVTAVLLLLLAWSLKRTIRRPSEGAMLTFLRFLIRQQHRRQRASAVSLLIPPSALCETAAVLGFVLFIIGGHSRADLYPLILAALVLMLLFFPTPEERDQLIRLDRETE